MVGAMSHSVFVARFDEKAVCASVVGGILGDNNCCCITKGTATTFLAYVAY